ncbi:protein disulfide isomerase [Irpex rosettiformis]|uniref:Protein disulfide isomerase n=1 Tax=Irpex rosettiformis TaxID=378272 RepID=A0ACB8U528_9APHY|nr:protein disulfide isomerase [Irpex rosettiformis]
MRFSQLLSGASLFALFSFVTASDVINLTAENFDSVVNPEELILVEFFAPWCGHCKALAPHYEEAATALKDKKIKLAKVDCVDQADLCQQNGIGGYPTLRVYRQGEFSPYSGSRNTEGLVSYMTKQSLPAVADVTKATFHEFKNADKIVALAFLASPTDAPAAEFSAFANKHRDDYLFGITTDQEVSESAGVKPPAVVLYRSFDEPVTEYPYPVPDLSSEEFGAWIKELAVPIIDQVGGENYGTYAQSGKPLAYLFLDPTDEKRQEYIDAIRPIAAKYKGKVNFVWIDAIQFGDHGKALNLVEAKWPSFVLQDLNKQLKYPLDQSQEVIPELVDELVESFLDGKLEPSLKSQPIPDSQDEDVFVLVQKQFEDIVYDDAKDVLVEFYAPWCGHCKRLKPVWDDLGKHFADFSDSLVVAKMDATENDLPPSAPFHISGFPTIKFKKAGTREFIEYEGDRTLESLIAFVEENVANKLEKKIVDDSEPAAQKPLGSQKVTGHEGHDHHDEL